MAVKPGRPSGRVRRLEVRMDSELVVRQMIGQHQARNAGLKPLFAEARRLLERFEQVDFRHVPREQNQLADALANRAMDRRG
ncbi:MAG: ribonuclease HI family protein [Thermodesulfobacteriota bacterium]